MAMQPTGYTAPVAGVLSELWYSTDGTAAELEQIFGVQSVPSPYTAKEDITYRTLESDTEFAVKGTRPYEAIEVECILYKEQFTAVKTIADTNAELFWYLKLPSTLAMVISWKGGVDISLSEVTPDDMIRCVVKIGKTSVPEIISTLPTV